MGEGRDIDVKLQFHLQRNVLVIDTTSTIGVCIMLLNTRSTTIRKNLSN